ncbi:MAG: hypothetical protein FD143_1251 [Ignavibacteria bacterium]|nr:MAG: hypothetical protein FD143_1251 [Ignavibacteria bacterium]KAF0160761.1 MAG: hypothetical protein FD188_1537 [Ignavibacteria bacterium]
MELIQIIYNILLFGGGFVLAIMIVSYVVSKTRQQELRSNYQIEKSNISEQLVRERVSYQNQAPSILPANQLQREQNKIRPNAAQSNPNVFPIDQFQPRELKVVRKSSASEEQKTRTTQERLNNGRRYTIVNESISKSNSRVINFYL